jgi:hypothetical protein
MNLAQKIYDFLDIGKSPHIADCIFVMSGKQERKTYGIKMWRFGYAAQLILSVNRFEWQQFKDLNLESDGGLEGLAEKMLPKKQHFLVRMDRQETHCTAVQKGFWEIRSESKALAACLGKLPVRSLLVVSSPLYLRRVALIFRRAFRKNGIHLAYVAVPDKISLDTPAARSQVWSEFLKYIFSRLFFV